MRSSRCGEARPVRTVASSPRVDSTDLCMRSFASARSSSISSTVLLASGGAAAGNQRAHPLTGDDPIYVLRVRHVEDVDRQVVVHAKGKRGRIHDLQTLLDRLAVGDLGNELRIGV